MEIQILTPKSLKIKGKNVVFLANPEDIKTKTESSCILEFLANKDSANKKIEGSRLTVNAPGEYEVSGAKVVSFRSNNDIIYSIRMDGLGILLGKIEAIEQLKDRLGEKHHVLVAQVDEKINEETVTSLEVSVAVLFGTYAKEVVRVLGKESTPVSKYQTTVEKLPAEMEVVVLG